MKNKNTLAFILAILTLSSCNPAPSGGTGGSSKGNYKTIKIGNCEYIEVREGALDQAVYSLTHKGDCSNPIHAHNGGSHE